MVKYQYEIRKVRRTRNRQQVTIGNDFCSPGTYVLVMKVDSQKFIIPDAVQKATLSNDRQE